MTLKSEYNWIILSFTITVLKLALTGKEMLVFQFLDKDTGMRKFSRSEQGSSWAVEVGNDQKVCPIIVENINMNGQMLVEVIETLRNLLFLCPK